MFVRVSDKTFIGLYFNSANNNFVKTKAVWVYERLMLRRDENEIRRFIIISAPVIGRQENKRSFEKNVSELFINALLRSIEFQFHILPVIIPNAISGWFFVIRYAFPFKNTGRTLEPNLRAVCLNVRVYIRRLIEIYAANIYLYKSGTSWR